MMANIYLKDFIMQKKDKDYDARLEVIKAKMQISPPIIAYQGDIVYQGGSRNMM